MKYVSISSDLDSLDSVLRKFIKYDQFHPIASDQFVGRVKGLKTFNSSNPYKALLDEINEMESEFNIELKHANDEEVECNIDQIHDDVISLHQELSEDVAKIRKIEEEIKLYEMSLEQVENLENLEISLDDIFDCKFIFSRFGRLPLDSVEKIKYYHNKPFIFKDFKIKDNYLWCMYMGINEYKQEIDNIFATLFFERIIIPEFVHGLPINAKKQLEKKVVVLKEELEIAKNELGRTKQNCIGSLSRAKHELEYLGKTFEAKRYVVGLGERFTISGFIAQKNVNTFQDHFKNIKDVEIEVRPANSDLRINPPTKLKNNWFSKPFEMYVEMYGTPSYSDVDPTLFLSITYTLLFGIMFGDFGQGLLMSLIGFLLTKYKKMPLGSIISRIGISSAFFGLIYGSFFGNEEILGNLYQKIGIKSNFLPLHVMSSSVTMNLLIGTVIIGAILIFSSITLNILVKIRNKDYVHAIFSNNGLTGLLFYGFILAGIMLNMLFKINIFNIFTILMLILIPLLIIFFKEPLERIFHKKKAFPDGVGGFFIEGFFELFEVLLSYVTNTMSFLRVGGFILSHAGMMLVVNKLMEMTGSGANIPVAIFGNLFVMGLEGLIVGIQVLRLEFYEMFSRYYEGDGIPFAPIKF